MSAQARGLLFLPGIILIAGCAAPTPAPTPTPRPTPTVITVYLEPELDVLQPTLASCAASVPDTGILVFPAEPDFIPEGTDVLLIRLGDPGPEQVQAALLGYERIMVAAAAGNGLDIGSDEDVRALFSGGVSNWTLWVPLPGTAMRLELDRVMGEADYSPDAFLAPNAGAMVSALDEDPAAVGLLGAAWLTAGMEAVYELTELPVLAVTDGVPEGRLRELVGCVQLNPVFNSH